MDSQVYYIIVAMTLASVTLSIIFFLAWNRPPARDQGRR